MSVTSNGLSVNGQLDYWTLLKLLKIQSTVVSTPAAVTPEVTAAQLAALQAQVTSLQDQIDNILNVIAVNSSRSLVQNQETGAFHKMLYLPTIQDIIVDSNPFTGT